MLEIAHRVVEGLIARERHLTLDRRAFAASSRKWPFADTDAGIQELLHKGIHDSRRNTPCVPQRRHKRLALRHAVPEQHGIAVLTNRLRKPARQVIAT